MSDRGAPVHGRDTGLTTSSAAGGSSDDSTIDRTFRNEWGRVVAVPGRAFGDLDLAEDAAQEAFAEAAGTWPSRGTPRNPAAWITAVARRRAIDRLRRESVRDDKYRQAVQTTDASSWPDLDASGETIDDDLLSLVFTCCHPALEPHVQVALTLRLVAGLETAEIARGFLVPEATLAQRLVRAKQKIRAANMHRRCRPQSASRCTGTSASQGKPTARSSDDPSAPAGAGAQRAATPRSERRRRARVVRQVRASWGREPRRAAARGSHVAARRCRGAAPSGASESMTRSQAAASRARRRVDSSLLDVWWSARRSSYLDNVPHRRFVRCCARKEGL